MISDTEVLALYRTCPWPTGLMMFEFQPIPAYIQLNSQVIIIERTHQEVQNKSSNYCFEVHKHDVHSQRKWTSCMSVMQIMKGIEDDACLNFYGKQECNIPYLFQKETQSYTKTPQFQLKSQLTIFFWCKRKLKLEFARHYEKLPFSFTLNYKFTTICKPNINYDIVPAKLEVWNRGIYKEHYGEIDDTNKRSWFTTSFVYHVKRINNPLSLKQMCHTIILAKQLKGKCCNKRMDVRHITSSKKVPKLLALPKYYEIVLLTGPIYPDLDNVQCNPYAKVLFKYQSVNQYLKRYFI